MKKVLFVLAFVAVYGVSLAMTQATPMVSVDETIVVVEDKVDKDEPKKAQAKGEAKACSGTKDAKACSGDKAAKSDCASKCAGEKSAKKSDCASSCSGKK